MSPDLREFLAFMGAFIPAALLVIGALTIGAIRGIAHPMDASSCNGFGKTSGYEVRFVDYNFMSWDCLAKTANGKWISTKNLQGVNQ
jgi:hypothetical protein